MMEVLCVLVAFALGLVLGERFAKWDKDRPKDKPEEQVTGVKSSAEVQFENLFAYNGTSNGQQQLPREGGEKE